MSNNPWGYSIISRRMLANAEAAKTSDAARLANELQRGFPDATRTELLREAERLQRAHGMGLVLGGSDVVR